MDTEIISSAQNPTIKRIKKLLSSTKFRQSEEVAIAEGIHLAKSYIASGRVPMTVMYSDSGLQNKEIAALNEQLYDKDVSRLIVKDSLFSSLCDIHAKVGVLILFRPEATTAPEKLATDAMILEDVQDPGNLGTMLRTAAAAGVEDIYLSPGSASVWSPKALRAGMGAQFSLKMYEGIDVVEVVRGAEVATLATYLTDSTSLYDTDLSLKVAWVFGSEGRGISPELLAVCSGRVTIPQSDTSVESLNVAASAAVCLFEQRRQRIVVS